MIWFFKTMARAAGTLLAATVLAGPAAAQSTPVSISLDWVVGGTHAPFFVAREKGFFDEAGISATIDAGRGAGNVATNVATGVYQFGWIDMPTVVKFNAANPDNPLLAVYMSFDDTPLAIITTQEKGISKPADLDGKVIAGGPGTAAHDTADILLRAVGAEDVKINWSAVSPQLFGPMFLRGELDGLGGFTNSQIPALMEMGIPREDIVAIKYSDYGTDLYGLALVTTAAYAKENSKIVSGVVSALNRGTIETIKDPDGAMKTILATDPTMKPDIERAKLDLSLELTYTAYTREAGLSSVQPERLAHMTEEVLAVYGLESGPSTETVFSDAYLPPVDERMVK